MPSECWIWPGMVVLRNPVCWKAKSSALLRYVAESLEAGIVHRRGIVERLLLLSGMPLPCFVVLSVISSTVAWYSGCCSCFSAVISAISSTIAWCSGCLSSSFWASCGVGGVGGVECWVAGVASCCKFACIEACRLASSCLNRSFACCWRIYFARFWRIFACWWNHLQSSSVVD